MLGVFSYPDAAYTDADYPDADYPDSDYPDANYTDWNGDCILLRWPEVINACVSKEDVHNTNFSTYVL